MQPHEDVEDVIIQTTERMAQSLVQGCPIPEGQSCPTCKRRVPKKKKPGSPQTKVFSFRVPVDDADTFQELLAAAADHAGLTEKGHWQFWTLHRGLVLLLQELPSEASGGEQNG